MELLFCSVLVIILAAFLQHGFSAVVGGKSVIDSISEAVGKTHPSERNDGVTGRIAPPASKVSPCVKPENTPSTPEALQSTKNERVSTENTPVRRKKQPSACIIILASLLLISLAGNVCMYSAMNKARSYAEYVQSEKEKEVKLKEDLLKKYQETADTLAFWSTRGCVVKDGSSVYHEDIHCPKADEDSLSVLSIKDALHKGYAPCDRCANEWRAIYFQSID